MNAPPWEILLTSDPLRPPAPVFTAHSGGVVDFYGVVRGLEGADAIAGLDYEAHQEMARHQLRKLVDEAAERFPVLGVILHHRIGVVPVAEPSLFLRVSAAHRGPAFEAAEWLVEVLKQRVPIWKHPVALEVANAPAYPEGEA